jgi:large subunit ribosomal protein L18
MRIAKRRRREAKTNYSKRRKMLKGETPRIIFRKTNKYIISQYISSSNAQDKIELGVTSKELLRYGWLQNAENSLKNITASYLTGYLMGKKIIQGKMKTPILDIGMTRNLHKTKIYGFLKGLVDSGVKIKYSNKKDIFPEEGRINGGHLKNKVPFNEIKSKIDKL